MDISDDPLLPNLACVSVDAYGSDGPPGQYEMMLWWEKARPWLAKRGVNLYETNDKTGNDVQCCCWLSFREIGDTPAPLPFATCVPPDDRMLRPARWLDRSLPDLRRLLEDKACSDPSQFPCVLPPLAVLDTPYDFSFVVMPMWGPLTTASMLNIETVGEVLHFMACTLRGLVFLHDLRIAHRDIDEINIMVNYYRYDNDVQAQVNDLPAHRKAGRVCYALMDFNQSIILPDCTCVKTCRRPADEAWHGSVMYKPWDITLGEPTYNPFAYDVGMLGNLFRTYFAEAVRHVPAFAALFDKMTTWVVHERFTAHEASEFFHHATDNLDEAIINTKIVLQIPEYRDEYWSKLSPQTCRIWGLYRTPPETWREKVLECLMQFRPTRYIVLFVRRIMNF